MSARIIKKKIFITCIVATQIITHNYVDIWRTFNKLYNIYSTCIARLHIEAHLFGSMKEDEKCDCNHTLVDDCRA